MTELFWTMACLFIGMPLVLIVTLKLFEWLFPVQEPVTIPAEDE